MKKRIISTAIAAILAVSALSTSAFAATNFATDTEVDDYSAAGKEFVAYGGYLDSDFDVSDGAQKLVGTDGAVGSYYTKTLSNGLVVKTAALTEAGTTTKITAAFLNRQIEAYEGLTANSLGDTKATAQAALTAGEIYATKRFTGTQSESTIVFTGKLVAPKIKITVPTTLDGAAKYVLNPYALQVQYNDNDMEEEGYTDAQVISQKLKFHNESDCAIGVGVKLYSSAAGSAKVGTAPIAEEDTYKTIFIYAVGGEAVADEDDVTVAPTAYSEDAANILAQTKTAGGQKAFKTLLTLEGYDEDAENNVFGAIDLQGELNTHLKAGTEWEEGDTLTVNFVYQFSQVKMD